MSYIKKGLPWIKGAKNVEDCKTSKEVMKKAGLDFFVKKCSLVAKMPMNFNNVADVQDEDDDSFFYGGDTYRECPNAYATYRTDRNIPLGIVGSKYEVVQNIDAFDFFDKIVGEDNAKFQTAGAFGDGHRIFVSAKLPNSIELKNRDLIDNYLIFTNTHDGSTGVNILFSPIRVVCENTLNAAIKSSSCFVRFRHTQNVHTRIELADEILGITASMSNGVNGLYNVLVDKPISDDQVRDYIAKVYLTPAEYSKVKEYDKDFGIKKLFNRNYLTMEATGISTKKVNTMANTLKYYFDGIAQNDIVGTAWGAYNAVTGYFSNIANLDGLKRMDSLLYGTGNKTTSVALDLALNVA